MSPPLKLQYIPVTRVENMCATGTEALRAAAYAVAAGACEIALAVGVEKLKDTGLDWCAADQCYRQVHDGDNRDGNGAFPPWDVCSISFEIF